MKFSIARDALIKPLNLVAGSSMTANATHFVKRIAGPQDKTLCHRHRPEVELVDVSRKAVDGGHGTFRKLVDICNRPRVPQ